MNSNLAPPSAKIHSPTAWSAFLGVSWTWCIGMFLPVLLVRDFGVAGFLVFAIPNIVGAGAMGTVLRDAESSRRFVADHLAACAAFSSVTIVFHIFFVWWMTQLGVMPASAPLLVCGASLAFTIILAFARGAILGAWLVLAASLAALVSFLHKAPDALRGLRILGPLPSHNLMGLSAVCVLGFLLCPYLDLTFHRARQSTSPRGGIVAFTLGFGVCFAAMILFTLFYAPLLTGPIEKRNWAIRIVGIHMMLQCGFTIAAHLVAIMVHRLRPALSGGIVAMVLTLPLLLAGLIQPNELIYRLFMSFYGLLFPAYLWIRAGTAPTAWSWIVCAVAICGAAPFYWMGFVEEKMLWLLPGVAIVLLSRLLVTRAGPLPIAENADPKPPAHAPSTSES